MVASSPTVLGARFDGLRLLLRLADRLRDLSEGAITFSALSRAIEMLPAKLNTPI